MTPLFIGIYGIYFLLVGMQGNAAALMELMRRDVPGYAPWFLAIVVIAFLSQYETTEKLVKPFIALLILNFVLMNFDTIKGEVQKIYNLSGNQNAQ